MTSASASAEQEAGMAVARAAVAHAVALLGPRLVSAYAIGSLAHGGYSAAVSDVDVTLLVDRCDAGVAEIVAGTVARTQAALGPGLADRLSVFYGDWPTFAAPPPAARMGAIDRLDLMEHGRLLHGVDRRLADGAVPARDELVAETARFLAARPSDVPPSAELVAAGPRPLTKAVLFPVRFMHTHATGRAGSNEDAAGWYRDAGRPHVALVDAALRWRHGAVLAGNAICLLDAHLRGLHEECRRTFAAPR
jgi:hypothetical protein